MPGGRKTVGTPLLAAPSGREPVGASGGVAPPQYRRVGRAWSAAVGATRSITLSTRSRPHPDPRSLRLPRAPPREHRGAESEAQVASRVGQVEGKLCSGSWQGVPGLAGEWPGVDDLAWGGCGSIPLSAFVPPQCFGGSSLQSCVTVALWGSSGAWYSSGSAAWLGELVWAPVPRALSREGRRGVGRARSAARGRDPARGGPEGQAPEVDVTGLHWPVGNVAQCGASLWCGRSGPPRVAWSSAASRAPGP